MIAVCRVIRKLLAELNILDGVTSTAAWRRNRDMLIIFTGVYYLLNIVDAHIFAHLNEFDINNDLSVRVKPSLEKINTSNLVGVSLYFSF